MTKTLVLIPTDNEKDNIPILVADLLAIPGVSVLVIAATSPAGPGTHPQDPGATIPAGATQPN